MNKFCFVIHPTSLVDVARYEPGAVGKGEPLIRKILEWMPPYLAAKVTGVRTPDGRETEGYFTAAPLLPEQMLELPREEVFERILAAIQLGVDQGAQIAGLGAFTAIIGDGGKTIAERSPIPVTTGNSLTIVAAVESLFRGAAAMDIDAANATVAVVGATGSIGSACVRLLAPRVGKLVLVAPNAGRLENFHRDIRDSLEAPSIATTDVHAAVRQSDLILTATASTRDFILAEDLRPGAVVCDISLPHNVAHRVVEARPDVLVIEGGAMRMPGNARIERMREPGREFDLGLSPQCALACMAETMVLALESRFENYTLGRGIDLERVREIDRLARECGFSLGDMRAFETAITAEDIAKKRSAIANFAVSEQVAQ